MAKATIKNSMTKTRDKKDVMELVRKHDVKFIRLWFTDIHGQLKSFAVPVDELEFAFNEGMGFDGSSIKGFARIDESDMIARPDPTTFVILPWRPAERAVARMFCDIFEPDGSPYKGDPRYVLKVNLEKAKQKGFTLYVGPELEYFYFKSDKATETLDEGGYFDYPLDAAEDLRRDTILALETMGIQVEYSHHEVAHSQHEIDLRYADALTMADIVMTHRIIVKEIAKQYNVYATFMPKPIYGQNGSGMHTHQSLFKGNQNAFFDPKDPYFLSDTAKKYIAGLLTHVKVRVPLYKPGKEKATRLELRSPDPSCNPYLAFACMLNAGLKGVEKGYKLPDPMEMDVYHLSEEERAKYHIDTLPGSLNRAIEYAESSELLRETLGDHIFEQFIMSKKVEWDDYRIKIHPFEIERYLPIL
ncbi:MAG: glnA [Nitrospirae bacterium]|nr:glnA [Nitrospirota bacterium]